MEIRRDVFQAIADPTRREIITIVARRPQNLNAIADQFDVTRQAVSLHIKILNECGLIMITKKGRERYCEARLEQLSEVQEWVAHSKKLWAGRFNALEKLLDELQTKSPKKVSKTRKNGARK
ncbi:transcriptional regulator [Sphingobacteriaceae bacterium]|nr:transcriptional regulator [Sphingobacteriaceae bacterium]